MRLTSLFLFLLIASTSFGQVRKERSIKIQYDPLFWKANLKLTRDQSLKISQINSQFYSSLVEASHQSYTQKQKSMEQLLNERNSSILSVFSPRQRSKWAKIETGFLGKV